MSNSVSIARSGESSFSKDAFSPNLLIADTNNTRFVGVVTLDLTRKYLFTFNQQLEPCWTEECARTFTLPQDYLLQSLRAPSTAV